MSRREAAHRALDVLAAHRALDVLIVGLERQTADDYVEAGDFANMLINTDGYDVLQGTLVDYWLNEVGR